MALIQPLKRNQEETGINITSQKLKKKKNLQTWECHGKIHLPSDRLATCHLFLKARAYPTSELIPFEARDRNPKAPSAQRAALLPRTLDVQLFSWPSPPPHNTSVLLVFIFTSARSILLLRRSSKSSSRFVSHLLSSTTFKQRVLGGFS